MILPGTPLATTSIVSSACCEAVTVVIEATIVRSRTRRWCDCGSSGGGGGCCASAQRFLQLRSSSPNSRKRLTAFAAASFSCKSVSRSVTTSGSNRRHRSASRVVALAETRVSYAYSPVPPLPSVKATSSTHHWWLFMLFMQSFRRSSRFVRGGSAVVMSCPLDTLDHCFA